MNKEQYQEETEIKEKTTTIKSIVVYNDDVNSFDHVIGCFMSILGHEQEKAVIEAYTIHFEGKCEVKSGSYKELEPYALSLLNQKLSCKIE